MRGHHRHTVALSGVALCGVGLATALAGAVPAAAAPAAGQSRLSVVTAASASGTAAVVAVPFALSGMTVPTKDWSATSASGSSLPVTTTRLIGSQFQVLLVFEQSPSVIVAEQGAAAEFLHQLPASIPAGVSDGATVKGTSRDSALAAVGKLSAHASLGASLTAAHRDLTSTSRTAVVVFARCSSLAAVQSHLPSPLAGREVDLVGLGSGCGALTGPIAKRDGIIVTGAGSGPDLTAASDGIAHRLQGEYAVTVPGASGSAVSLSVAAGQQKFTTSVHLTRFATTGHGHQSPPALHPTPSASAASSAPAVVADPGGNGGSGSDSNTGDNVVRGIAAAVVVLTGAAMLWAIRRRPTVARGRHGRV